MKDRSEEDEVADININTVNKYYGDVHVIKDVSLDIKSQSFTVLVGPSGCGKSTMLRMIAGLEDINSGTISIDGQVVNDLPPKQRNIAMVFQSYALYPHMTVFDNMAFGLKLEKRSKDEINERVQEAARILQIEDYLHRKPKQLSGGQRQQVALGRALMIKPTVLMLDEPTAGVSPIVMDELFDHIVKVKRTNVAILMVEQNAKQALSISDRGYVLVTGENRYSGTGKELLDDPRVRSSFLGG